MGQKRSLGVNPDGREDFFEYDEANDAAIVHTVADVEPIIEQNKKLQTDGTGGWTPRRDLRKIARIPSALVPELNQLYGCNVMAKENRDVLKRILADPMWRFLRTY